jgi:hypothetical protein
MMKKAMPPKGMKKSMPMAKKAGKCKMCGK